jgi:hypothetical protein
MKKRHLKRGFKFGIQIPTMVEEALALDKANGNNFWLEAIIKEMTNVWIAFNILEKGAVPPVGYRRIPCHMIFDIKMDFTRKARFVAGGHVMVSAYVYYLFIRSVS